MILDHLFTQLLFEAADPSRLIVSITIQPMSSGGEPMQKEIDLTGQFQGSTASQMNQAMDYMSKMLESKGLAFNDLSVSYQGRTITGQNRGAMSPQSDWEKEAEAKAAQMRTQRPTQNATPAVKESKSNHITQFASNAHEEWRRNFDPTGTKPRIKKNSDGTEGDINVPFADLHPDWQKENLAAAHAAHRAVKHFGRDMEKAAEYVHNEWMKRNPRADYNAAQHVPYDDLPEDEKEKDRVHVRTMMQLMGHRPEQGVAEDATSDLLNMRRDDPRVQRNQDINVLAKEIYSQMVAERGQPMDRGQQNNWVAIAQTKAAAKLQQSTPQTQNNVPALKSLPGEQPETPSFIKKSSTQWESQGVAEGLPGSLSKSDYTPGATKKHVNTNCTTCHGRKGMYKLDGKLFADNKVGAVRVKCPTCHGTGDKPGVAEGNMPKSVIQSKQKYADMSDQEFHAAHKNKSEDDLRSMAWRHGYGKNSNHYVNRHKKGSQGMSEGINPLMKKLHQALLKEGRVKELADDLKTLNDAEFMKKYGKVKAAIRRDMKKVDEAAPAAPSQPGVAEAHMSAAQRLWNAEQKQRAKSDASLRRTPSSIPKKQEPVDQDKQVAAKVDESRRARQSLMARIVNSR